MILLKKMRIIFVIFIFKFIPTSPPQSNPPPIIGKRIYYKSQYTKRGYQMTTLLYVQTSGIDTPERLYSPFILAQTAKAMGIDSIVYFLGMGITVVKKGNADKIKMGKFPSLKEVMDQSVKAGVKLMVCEQSCQLINLDKGDFIPPAEIVGAATLNDLVLDADGTMWF